MVKADVLVFDMDGVLVDVKASYRECIIATVHRLTGATVTQDQIQGYKNRGGFNNDWLLSQQMCADLGRTIEYQEVVRVFNDLFFREFMKREKWLPGDGLLARWASRYPLYIFTGRLREEAMMTLRNFHSESYFNDVLGDDNVARSKPAPDGLIAIQARHPGAVLLYLGDTVDDLGAALGAQVPFIGVGPHSGADTFVGDINELENLLA